MCSGTGWAQVVPKIHAPSEEGLQTSLCGMIGSTLAVDAKLVTCKRCQRALSKQRKLREVSFEEAIRDVLTLLSGPPIEPYPEMTPAAWQQMRCRKGMSHCSCRFCLVDDMNTRALANWQESQAIRPHMKHSHEFGSVNAALECLLRWRRDGASARSSQGGIQARAEETARLGTQVQTTARYDRDSIELRRATWATDIERACFRAFAEEQERRGLTSRECVAIVLSTVDAQNVVTPEQWAEHTGLTVSSVKGLVRHGRKALTIELAASGYIPRPRARAGLDRAIATRAQEVAA